MSMIVHVTRSDCLRVVAESVLGWHSIGLEHMREQLGKHLESLVVGYTLWLHVSRCRLDFLAC